MPRNRKFSYPNNVANLSNKIDSKIVVGRVRSKYTGTSLFGGGSLNSELLTEGLKEKEELETQLYTGAAPGQGDSDPPLFFVG